MANNLTTVAIKYNVKMNKRLQKTIDRETPKNLEEAARYVFRIARSMIHQKNNPNVASQPGTSPYAHARAWNKGFRRTIVWAKDGKFAVVVGPQLVRQGLSELARTHEFGGTRRVKENIFPDIVQPAPSPNPKPRSAAQKAASRKYFQQKRKEEREKAGKPVKWVLRNFPARPYMRPALEFSLPKLSKFWVNTVR